MTLAEILQWIHLIVSVVLIALILLQSQSEGGLGAAFGGSNDGGAKHVRRGLEKLLFQATIVTAIIFALLSISYFFI